MSIFFTSTDGDQPQAVTVQDIRQVAAAYNVTLPPKDEETYLGLLNAADGAIRHVESLPIYTPPSLIPKDVPGYSRPKPEDNPLNAWSHKATFQSKPKTGPLAGRSVVFKDNVSVAGLPLTCGTFPQFLSVDGVYPLSTIDASVVSRVKDAGGIVTGTASCENYSLCALSYSSANGIVHNPWAPGRATGGSSSGCAALLAVNGAKEWRKRNGMTSDSVDGYKGIDLAVGGDQGGSIRLPSAFCGIYGLKPTHGLVPYTGIASLHPLIDHCGPMANSVADVATLLTALAGYDGLDPRMTPESPLRCHAEDYAGILRNKIQERTTAGTWTAGRAGEGLRIGVLREGWDVAGLDAEVAAVVRKAADRFSQLGAAVRDVSVPLHMQGPLIWTASTRAAMAGFAFANNPPPFPCYALPGLHPPKPGQAWVDSLSHHNPAAVNVLFSSAYLSQHHTSSTAKALTHVLELRAAYDAALQDVDVLVLPVNLTVAPPHPTDDMGVLERIQLAAGNTANTCPFNASGHPALSIPVGWASAPGANDRGKLPVGMQIVGRRWAEGDVLFAAAVWEVGGLGLDSM